MIGSKTITANFLITIKNIFVLKIIWVLSFFFLLLSCICSQNSPLYDNEHFIISYATSGETNITKQVVSNGGFIRFYPIGQSMDTLYMANVWPKSYSQSFGLISEIDRYQDFYKGNKIDMISFKWEYHNTYDGKSGKARVKLLKVYKIDYVDFTISIIPENDNEIFYSGMIKLRSF